MEAQEAPQFMGEQYAQQRQRIIDRFQCSEEEAADRLKTTWDNAFQALFLPEPPQNPPPSPPHSTREDQAMASKKTAPRDFDVDAAIPDRIPNSPSEFAIGKLENLEYVELWYFTTEGRREASISFPTTHNNSVGLLETELGLSLQLPSKSSRPSKNVIIDENLTWVQVMEARHSFVAAVDHAGWPEKHVQALGIFYVNLESLKMDGYDPKPLILYQAVARRNWHRTLKGKGNSFNISIINESLLFELKNQILVHDQKELQQQASILPFPPLAFTNSQPPSPHAAHLLPHLCNAMLPHLATNPSHATP